MENEHSQAINCEDESVVDNQDYNENNKGPESSDKSSKER